MSLMKSLARVAAGVMLAKGIGAMMQNRQAGSTVQQGSATRRDTGGGLLGDLFGNNVPENGRSLDESLSEVLGGKRSAGSGRPYGGPNSAGATGGLGGLLDSLTNSARGSGGLGDILGQLGGGTKPARSGGASGGLGDLLGGLLGAGAAGGLASKGAQQTNDASFGELFNDAVSQGGEPEVQPTPEQNAVAGLMLKAMIQAAKSDGKIDDGEKQRLLGQLGNDLDADEREFVREQMAAPVDPAALAGEVPQGLEAQVYLMSLMAIDFDNKAEAQYLHDLGGAMGLSRHQVNAIHKELGVTPLYA